MKEFKREIKYLVLKWDDIDKYLTRIERENLLVVCKKIEIYRSFDGKEENNYVVVNEDEPYAEQVWELIRKHHLKEKK